MGESFDPYLKWLGIPKKDQPPHHYRLLGIEVFESDPEVISNAADQRMAHLKNFAAGTYSAISQRILNEIAAARVCLLNDSRKQQYDAELLAKMQPQQAPPVAPPATVPVAEAPHVAEAIPVAEAPAPMAAAAEAAQEQGPTVSAAPSSAAGRSFRRGRGRRSNSPLLLGFAAAVVAFLAIVLFGFLVGGSSDQEDPVASANGSDHSSNGATNGPKEPFEDREPGEKEPGDKQPESEPAVENQPAVDPATDGEPVEEPTEEPVEEPTEEPVEEPAEEPIEELIEESPDEELRTEVAIIDWPDIEPPVEPRTVAKPAAPTEEEKKEPLQAIRDIYRDDLRAADTTDAKRSLADTFHSQACDLDGDRVLQFVLFELAANTAAEGSDLKRAFRSIDKIDSIFEVNALAMKADTVEELAKAASQRKGTIGQNAQVVTVSRDLCEEALEKTELRVAEKLMKIAMPAARRMKNRELVAEIGDATRRVSRMLTQQRLVEKALEVLEETPDSPEACLTAGHWYCLVVGDWEKGLPWLAQCGNDEIAGVAALDLKKPSDKADLLALGDGWWDISEDRSGVEQYRARKRAVIWYERVIDDLSGLSKTKVQKRLREAGGGAGRFALKFDGRKSHVVVNNFTYPGTTPITVEAIVRVDPNLTYKSANGQTNSSRRQQTVICNSQMSGLFIGSYYSNWRAEFWYAYKASTQSSRLSAGQVRLSSTSTITPNRWTHLALVFDGKNAKLFVDGRLEGTGAIRGVHKPGTVPFVIGASPGRIGSDGSMAPINFFGGSIKALRISNTPRYTENFDPSTVLRPDASAKLLFDFREGLGSKLTPVGKTRAFGAIKDAQWIDLEDSSAAPVPARSTGENGNPAVGVPKSLFD